jgi:hypothetical protein
MVEREVFSTDTSSDSQGNGGGGQKGTQIHTKRRGCENV